MISDTQRRNQILRRINKIPEEKLGELDDFVSKLEKDISKKTKTLSYAGIWKDIDESTFQSLTKDLIQNRQRNRNKIDE